MVGLRERKLQMSHPPDKPNQHGLGNGRDELKQKKARLRRPMNGRLVKIFTTLFLRYTNYRIQNLWRNWLSGCR